MEVRSDDQVMGMTGSSNTEASSDMSLSENQGGNFPSFCFDEDVDMPLLFHENSSPGDC